MSYQTEMTDAEVGEIDAGIDAAKERLTADPNLRLRLKLVKVLGVTLEEAKWRYGQEKAFRETAHLLWAEDVIEAESFRKFGHGYPLALRKDFAAAHP